ncbi:MAG: hypothetical protein PHC61_11850 [Chitinivibrionales bacterium]|nr:hypothetical protein [Chitinivibrionales bacterium]
MKTKYFRIFFAVLFAAVSCHKKPPPVDFSAIVVKDTLAIVDYNVENMFDCIRNGGEYPEFIPDSCNWTKEIQQAKVQHCAQALADARPDIAVLEEVENCATAHQLQRELSQLDCRLPYCACGDRPNPTNTVPVILSRFPFTVVRCYGMPREGKYFTRNLLEAAVYLGKDTLTVFACHFPSKNNPESKRLNVARILRERLAQLDNRGAEYIVAGDLNSNYNECETILFDKSNDARGLTAINHVLRTVTSAPLQPSVFVDKRMLAAGGKPGFLYDPWLDVPQSRRMSAVFRQQPQTPDHILLSATLFDTAGLSYVDNSFAPFTDSGRLLLSNEPFRWQYSYRGQTRVHLGEGYSDHLPVVCKIRKGAFFADPAGGAPGAGLAAVTHTDDLDGWQPAQKSITLRPEGGRGGTPPCLRIEGLAGKSNGSAAVKTFRARRLKNDSVCYVALALKGEAVAGLRVRGCDAKWVYFNGPDFAPARSGRYTHIVNAGFKRITLRLPADCAGKEVLVELRVAKNSAVGLWIKRERGE